MKRRRRNPELTAEEERALSRAQKLIEQAEALDEDRAEIESELEEDLADLKAIERRIKTNTAKAMALQKKADQLDREARQIAKAAGVSEWL
jgi:hypothetical protein